MRYLTICLPALSFLAAPWESSRAEKAPESPEQIRPAHGRPFFMPPAERQSIKRLVRSQAWAKDEYAGVQQRAAEGDGFWSAFLYALEGNASYLPAAREYLRKQLGREAYWAPRYIGRLI